MRAEPHFDGVFGNSVKQAFVGKSLEQEVRERSEDILNNPEALARRAGDAKQNNWPLALFATALGVTETRLREALSRANIRYDE